MVAKPYRRQGVGRALMAAAEEWAREVGVRKLELHVFPYNDAAIALYEGLGYERQPERDWTPGGVELLSFGRPVGAL